jgi:hypothetical protein
MNKLHAYICSLRTRFVIFIIVGMLAGCGGGGGGENDPGTNMAPATVLTGVLADSVVSGVSYSTPTQSGLTNTNGQFNYIAGEQVAFSIGDIQLGSVNGGEVITPLTLAGTSDAGDQQVINIVRLLMTLDLDGDASNGIVITASTRSAAIGININFDVTPSDFGNDPAVTNLITSAETSSSALVDSGAAQLHLANTLASTWGLMEWGTGQWSVN